MKNLELQWQHWDRHGTLSSRKFVCGYCGDKVGAHMGYSNNASPAAKIYLCPNCGLPTFFWGEEQAPGPMIGREIKGLEPAVQEVYREIRETTKNGCYTAAILLGRKLIMHIAVDAGALEGKTFKEYVDFLATKHFVPPNAQKLLDYMRSLGNEKNHEIKLGSPDEVHKIVKFVESLLYFIYEIKTEFEDSGEENQ